MSSRAQVSDLFRRHGRFQGAVQKHVQPLRLIAEHGADDGAQAVPDGEIAAYADDDGEPGRLGGKGGCGAGAGLGGFSALLFVAFIAFAAQEFADRHRRAVGGEFVEEIETVFHGEPPRRRLCPFCRRGRAGHEVIGRSIPLFAADIPPGTDFSDNPRQRLEIGKEL